jgi:hypothetical protein
MNTRRINLALWVAAAGLAAAGVAVFAAGLLLPVDVDGLAAADGRGNVDDAAGRLVTGRRALPPLAEFEPAWAARLRAPLAPATAPAGGPAAGPAGDAPPVPPAAASPPVTLVGTIGDALALLRAPDGSVQVCAAGETLTGGATVLAVRPAQVDVRYNGQLVTLHRAADAAAADPFRQAVTPPPDGSVPTGPAPGDGEPPPDPPPDPDPQPGPAT